MSHWLSVFRGALERGPERPIVTIEESAESQSTLTFADVARGMASYAEAYRQRGVGRGDRVVIALPTSADFLFALWGCYALGAVPVPVYPPGGRRAALAVERLDGVMRCARPSVLVTLPSLVEALSAIALPDVVTAGLPGASFEAACAGAPEATDDVALIQFTSGSTLAPKGCVLTHRAMTANAKAIEERLRITERDVGVVWLPLYHDMGLVSGVFMPFFTGGRVVLSRTERFVVDPLSWLQTMDRHRATITAAPNFAFYFVTKRLARKSVKYDLSSVRSIFNGAEPIDPEVVRSFLRVLAPHGLRPEAVEPAWGLAENTVFVTSSPGGLRTDRVDRGSLETAGRAVPPREGAKAAELPCLGRPFPGAELRVVDAAGAPLPERSSGEIEIRTPSLMSGYFENAEASAAAFRDGWLRTGDVGYLAAGELYLVGRSKDLVIIGGRNVAPQDVERVVEGIAGVRPAGVIAFGRLSDSGTEELGVLVEVAPGQKDPDIPLRVRERCNEVLGLVPSVVEILGSGALPKTSSGKLQRSLAKAMFQRGELRGAAAAPAEGARE